jgi:hypothetical protein
MTARSIVLTTFVMITGATGLAAQQDDCFPLPDSHEAKTFAILSVPIAFTGARAPAAPRGMSIGLEAATLPDVDRTTATPTSCRPGKGPENTNPVAGILRPRLTAAARGFVFEIGWIPPVAMSGVKANLISFAVAHPFRLSSSWMLGLRAHATFGSLHGSITCDAKAIADPASECYHGTISDDSWHPNVFGAEAVLGAGTKNVRPHLGVGYTMLRPRFQVNFTSAEGSTDRRRVTVNLSRMAVFGGVTARFNTSSITAEAYSTPEDAVSARVVVRTLLKR